jgi:hypothetical protein
MPQCVLRVFEHGAEVLGRGSEAFVVEYLGERHVDVKVVLIQGVRDPLGLPCGKSIFDDFFAIAKLSGCAEADADHLTGPSAFDLVAQIVQRDGSRRIVPLRECGQHGRDDANEREDASGHAAHLSEEIVQDLRKLRLFRAAADFLFLDGVRFGRRFSLGRRSAVRIR